MDMINVTSDQNKDQNNELMLLRFPEVEEPEPTIPPPMLAKTDKLYVAVGKEVKANESLLVWAIRNSGGKKICIIHVHQPPQLVNILGKKYHFSTLNEEEAKACLEIEKQIMFRTLDAYTAIAVNFGARVLALHIENTSIEEGILELICKHKIDKLVMGAAADESSHMKLVEPTSKKAIYVHSHAPESCNIWFIYRGELICTRDGSLQAKAHHEPKIPSALRAVAERSNIDHIIRNLPQGSYCRDLGSGSSIISNKASLNSISRNPAVGPMEFPSLSYNRDIQVHPGPRHFEDSHTEDGGAGWHLERKQNRARVRVEYPQLEGSDDLAREMDACNSANRLYAQESLRRKEVERSLEKMKYEHIIELQSADDEKLSLIRQIQDYEQKLKDVLEIVEILADAVAKHESEKESLLKLCEERTDSPTFFCILSPDDIKAATYEFDPSFQLWEGDDWTAFTGFIAHTPVIVKIFPDALHGPLKYQREVEVLSKFRHPNLLSLIGACPDMNALIFEYIHNGSLEDRLQCKDGTPPLSWKTRIRIATELCSLLLFLQSRQPLGVVHGALTPACILLDSTFRCKVYNFWLSHMYPSENGSGEVTSPYIDPEIIATGEVTPASDVYSFGVILLQLLTGKSDSQIRQLVTEALTLQDLGSLLDSSAGEWPAVQAEQFAYLGLKCCDESSGNRPDLDLEVWRVLKPMRDSCQGSFNSVGGEAPSCFICPIFQEVMTDPHIAADGYTYEAEALKEWLDLGKTTSPMTNLPLDHQNLIPNHTLRSAIQEWKVHH